MKPITTAVAVILLLLCPSFAAAAQFSVPDAIEQHNMNGRIVSNTAQLQMALDLESIGFFIEDTASAYIINSGFITKVNSGTADVLIITNTKDLSTLSRLTEDGELSKLEMIRLGMMYARTEKSSNAPSILDVLRAI